jgi:hypothetical protein
MKRKSAAAQPSSSGVGSRKPENDPVDQFDGQSNAELAQ